MTRKPFAQRQAAKLDRALSGEHYILSHKQYAICDTCRSLRREKILGIKARISTSYAMAWKLLNPPCEHRPPPAHRATHLLCTNRLIEPHAIECLADLHQIIRCHVQHCQGLQNTPEYEHITIWKAQGRQQYPMYPPSVKCRNTKAHDKP